MKKRVFLLMALLMVVVSGCASKGDVAGKSPEKAKPASVVSLRNEYDDSVFERKKEVKPAYAISEAIYGLKYDVPSYMHKSDDAGRGYQVYVDHDDNHVRYVSCQVLSDAWSGIDLKDISEVSYADVVFEEMTGNDGDGYRRSAHYFFMTDKTNAGEHEMQVLVSVTADSDESCNEALEHIMGSMDFSDFYFDNFAE